MVKFGRKKEIGSKLIYSHIEDDHGCSINSVVIIRCFDNKNFYVSNRIGMNGKEIGYNSMYANFE